MTALQKLLAKVESNWAPADDEVVLRSWHNAFGHNWIAVKAYEAYNGSLDAAKALHDAVLPGYVMTIPENYKVVVSNSFSQWHVGEGKDHARAWLIAILKVLIAQEVAA
jgi:hypothetical protein